MVLNYIWIFFLIVGVAVAVVATIVTGSPDTMTAVMNSMFSSAKSGFEISIGLTGVLALWLGFLKIAEQGGVVETLSRAVAPFFSKIFPGIPANHPAMGTIFMNISANMLGLDNAATPLGLKAMEEMQTLNGKKDTASNAMIMFLVLNTSGLTLIPITIMTYRAQFGAANPCDVFLPILIATYFSTLAGFILTAIMQKINIFQRAIIIPIATLSAVILGALYLFTQMPPEQVTLYTNIISASIMLALICWFIISGMARKINVYDAFIDGAKEGFKVAIGIIPYLIAILVATGVFRASGAMDWLMQGIASMIEWMGIDNRFVGALPTALMKPLSGSGARGMMLDALNTYGADSFVGRLSCVLQGATDTTFYILALYFGSVGIKNSRHALPCGLFADAIGIIAAIIVAYIFFG